MPGPTFLAGDRLDLRTVTPDDYDFLLEHGNDPAVRRGAPAPTPVGRDDLAAFVEDDEASVQFLPCRDGTPVGFVFLFGIEQQRDHAELGCWIAPDEQGEGYATEATALCLDHAFDDRGLHKVVARVFEGNDASRTVIEKLGFQQEGRLREQDYVRGERHDTLLYGLLAREWRD
ncbi:GNAT family N-acetyltransferase [Halorientalis marina]|jgi:RimJ/RimL family protein N-acetyltransferase|uniref:GNAT family N-acetyltransferase n=1 Tax=Halorientalis marina TaxID=2931976 RepID=UPI001FF10353|nr:GNAT family protein [Halorientalis marina]